MPRKRSLATALLAASTLVADLATAQNDELAWIDRARLANGEVLMQSWAEGRGTVTIELAILIDADWQAIWQLLTACEVSPEYVPHVHACGRIDSRAARESLEADGESPDGADRPASGALNSEFFRQTVKPAFFLPKFDHVFRLDYFPPERIEVSHVSGPIDRMEGSWRLIPEPDAAVLLLHRMTVKPSFPVPRMFVRNTLERDLPPVLTEIRQRAEAAD
jgi:hypothetical protein